MGAAAPQRQTVDQGYGRTSRRYKLPTGEELDSVTSILSVLAKPALVAWAANTERALVLEAAANLYEDLPAGAPKMNRPAYLATLQTRLGKEKAHQRELAKASEIGSQAHALIEWNLRRERGETVGPEPRVTDKALWPFMIWEDWRARVALKPLAVEQVVWSRVHRYAGTLDLVAEITLPEGPAMVVLDWKTGKVAEITPPKGPVMVVLDWKTGKAIYDEALLQSAAYGAALIEMGHAAPGLWGGVVRLPKVETDPEPEIRLIPPAEQAGLLDAFLHVKAMWDWQQARQAAARQAPARVSPAVDGAAERRATLARIGQLLLDTALPAPVLTRLLREHCGVERIVALDDVTDVAALGALAEALSARVPVRRTA